MNQPTNQRGANAGPDAHLRVLRILWGAFLASIAVYALITFFVLRGRGAGAVGDDDPTLLVAFAALAFMSVAASFLLKRHFYAHAAERREPAKLQVGFILALVFCEMAALLGMVGLFVTSNKAGYLLMALGEFGLLLHFPRRDQVAAAYGKSIW